MTKKVYDLAIKTGTYTDRNGNEKGRWENVGIVLQLDDGGKMLLLKRTFNLAGVPDLRGEGGDMVPVSMFPPKEQDQQQSAPAPKQQGGFQQDQDVPFSSHERGWIA